jgi:DNA (cytosine-5)-methyltransferase 1
MRRLPHTDVLWASPICTEITPAGGRARRPRGQLDLLEEFGHVPKEGLERTRATFHDVIRAAEVHRYRAVIVENVTEAADWELFGWWLGGMTMLGYEHQFVSVSSAHVGGDRNPPAPQWRDRLYIVFTRKGIPLPDVSPRPLAWCWVCQEVVTAFQAWKRPGARKIGKYGRQYVYVCPNTACGHAQAEPFVLPAAAAIDWSDLGTRIGDRKRPLAANTIHRIRAGLEMFAPAAVVGLSRQDPPGSAYVRARPPHGSPLGAITTTRDEALTTSPFIVAVGGNTYERPGSGYVHAWPVHDGPMATPDGAFLTLLRSGRVRNVDPRGEPLAAVVTEGSNHGLVLPLGGANHKSSPTSSAEPMRTRMVRDTDALVTSPFITMLRGGADARGLADEPLATITGAGGHGGGNHALTCPPFLLKNYGGYCTDGHALVVPFRGRRSRATTTGAPLHTVATKDSAALVQPDDPDVMDCRLRMLKPREHLRAQRFPDSYVVKGNQGEQTMQAGNAVSANVAHWLGRAIAEVL